MKRKTKLIMGGGLAFAENKDMEKLAEQSRNGWHVLGFKYGFFYEFEQGEPADYIYSIDYREFADEELEEYKEITKEGGWDIIQYYGGIVILRAAAGTPPIYSDSSSFIEREKVSSQQIGKSLLIFISLCVALLAIRTFVHYGLNVEIWFVFDLIIWMIIGFTVPFGITYLIKKVKSKKIIN